MAAVATVLAVAMTSMAAAEVSGGENLVATVSDKLGRASGGRN